MFVPSRKLTLLDGPLSQQVLLSTMFKYLSTNLVLPCPSGTTASTLGFGQFAIG
jgi:hypothetical protein